MWRLIITLTHGRRAKLQTATKAEAEALKGLLELNPSIKSVEVIHV